jgi:hypothetical protein
MTDHPSEPTLHRFAAAELGDHLAAHVAAHVDVCSRCANVVRLHDPLTRAFASVDDVPVPPELLARVLAAVERSPMAERIAESVPVGAELAVGEAAVPAAAGERDHGTVRVGLMLLAAATALSGLLPALSVDSSSVLVDLVSRGLALRRAIAQVAPDDLSAASIALSSLMLVGALWMVARDRFNDDLLDPLGGEV